MVFFAWCQGENLMERGRRRDRGNGGKGGEVEGRVEAWGLVGKTLGRWERGVIEERGVDTHPKSPIPHFHHKIHL